MSNMDPIQETDSQKERLDKLLLMIGGFEVAIRDALENKDYDFLKVLKKKQVTYYERLRRVSYGLPEESTLPPEN